MFWFFGHENCGILPAQPGSKLYPLHWKAVLPTGPPRKSLFLVFKGICIVFSIVTVPIYSTNSVWGFKTLQLSYLAHSKASNPIALMHSWKIPHHILFTACFLGYCLLPIMKNLPTCSLDCLLFIFILLVLWFSNFSVLRIKRSLKEIRFQDHNPRNSNSRSLNVCHKLVL